VNLLVIFPVVPCDAWGGSSGVVWALDLVLAVVFFLGIRFRTTTSRVECHFEVDGQAVGMHRFSPRRASRLQNILPSVGIAIPAHHRGDHFHNRRRHSFEETDILLVIPDFILENRTKNISNLRPKTPTTSPATSESCPIFCPLYLSQKQVRAGRQSRSRRPLPDLFSCRRQGLLGRSGGAFTPCDTPGTSRFTHVPHLRNHVELLRSLPDFNCQIPGGGLQKRTSKGLFRRAVRRCQRSQQALLSPRIRASQTAAHTIPS